MRRTNDRSFLALVLFVVLLYWTVYLRFEETSALNLVHIRDRDVILEVSPTIVEKPIEIFIPNEEEENDDLEQTLDPPVDQGQEEGEEGWEGEQMIVNTTPTEVRKEELALVKKEEEENLAEHKYFPETRKPNGKYFFYQPSGGFGNQRFILRWAMIVANAMNRTLAVAPLAAHSDIWSGYNQWQKSDLLPADKVLDVKALEQSIERGVVFLDDIPLRVIEKMQNETNMKVMVHVKGHYVNRKAEVKRLLVYKESAIRNTWLKTADDIIFWDKMSMWQCCTPDFLPDTVWYGRHIMFNYAFKSLARTLTAHLGPYNAVHVRRGDMTISKDRRTAEVYYKSHHLDGFDKTMPLYVATNEKDLSWFNAFKLPGRFTKVVFWANLDQNGLREALKDFPKTMQGDILGFIEILICGNAVKWQGSRKSTFSASISAVRMSPQLRTISWEFPNKPSVLKRMSPADATTKLAAILEETKEEGEDLIVNDAAQQDEED